MFWKFQPSKTGNYLEEKSKNKVKKWCKHTLSRSYK